jgi:hypothetical protein
MPYLLARSSLGGPSLPEPAQNMSYDSDESGRKEVYVIGSNGAAVRTRPDFSADKPRVLFDGWFEFCAPPGCRSFDVTATAGL